MKISLRCHYALKVILDLSNHFQNNLVHITDLAERQNIPPKYLEQILTRLKKGGFIQSKKGPNGGYSLCGPPKGITVGEIIRVMEPSLFYTAHPNDGLPGNNGMTRNSFFGILEEVEEAISSVIDKVDFSEIQHREADVLSKENGAITYNI
jgi:Rrf2 family protein